MRCIRRVGGAGRGIQGLGVDVVGPGDHRQVPGLDLGVDLGAAGDDFELVDIARVEARALDGYAALVHLVTLDLAVLDHRLAGGQGGLGGVDEAAAVAGHAIGVGDNDMGRLPGHFGVALELAGAAAVDLVEDHIGRAAAQVGVAEDDPAELGLLGAAGGVVEDQPLLADVVVAELVVRQAAAIGRGNVDDGHPIAGLPQCCTAAVDHDAVGHRHHGLPEHHVGQDERQAALGQAAERITGLQDSRGLLGQEGEVANVHVSLLAMQEHKPLEPSS
ncbi:hypothetical protein BBH57_02060 [Pseudomonas protegens]|nr:hypothetical protein BBH57_02060 [Pseudomonas protegens]